MVPTSGETGCFPYLFVKDRVNFSAMGIVHSLDNYCEKVVLQDNPRRYKYRPYPISSGGVPFLLVCTTGDMEHI